MNRSFRRRSEWDLLQIFRRLDSLVEDGKLEIDLESHEACISMSSFSEFLPRPADHRWSSSLTYYRKLVRFMECLRGYSQFIRVSSECRAATNEAIRALGDDAEISSAMLRRFRRSSVAGVLANRSFTLLILSDVPSFRLRYSIILSSRRCWWRFGRLVSQVSIVKFFSPDV